MCLDDSVFVINSILLLVKTFAGMFACIFDYFYFVKLPIHIMCSFIRFRDMVLEMNVALTSSSVNCSLTPACDIQEYKYLHSGHCRATMECKDFTSGH